MAYEYAALPNSSRMTPESYAQAVVGGQRGPESFWSGFPASKVAFAVQDFAEKFVQDFGLSKYQEYMPTLLDTGFEVIADVVRGGPVGQVQTVRKAIEDQMSYTFIAMKAGLWAGAGSVFSALVEDFYGTSALLQAYKNLAYNIGVTPRMRRFYNTVYTPNWPNMTMAFQMMCRGLIPEEDVKTAGSYDGWPDEMIPNLLNILYNQPTPHEAFFMWRKDVATEDVLKAMVRVAGFKDEWYNAILENFWYSLTLYDMVRLADFIEMDQTWALKQLKRRGLKDEDAAKVWEMLEIRPLREEIRGLTTKWMWRARMGRASLDELRAKFLTYGVKTKEREYLVEKAQLDYEDELVDEWVDILRWRFRTAVISEEEFMQGLLDLGIIYEKANLIVELEKAKGYYGYY